MSPRFYAVAGGLIVAIGAACGLLCSAAAWVMRVVYA